MRLAKCVSPGAQDKFPMSYVTLRNHSQHLPHAELGPVRNHSPVGLATCQAIEYQIHGPCSAYMALDGVSQMV